MSDPAEPAGAPAAQSDAAQLGDALRRARKARGLSLEQVAGETSISRSLLSLIETGRSDVTIGRLSRLARLYDVRLADLVPEPRHPDPIVVRAGDRRGVHSGSEGIAIEILVPEGSRTLQAILATFEPHAAMQDEVVPTDEQFTYVLEGTIRTVFTHGGEVELGPGDSATYHSGGHRHENLSAGAARMLIAGRRPPKR